jgi:C4-dicarboxylate-specific signal transduction histidine kinase
MTELALALPPYARALDMAIVDELARAYGGALILGDSATGGLKVEITLPRAEA